RYVSAKLQIFRVGDIVEAQCLMVFLRTNKGTARMKMILRALTLVNSNNSMVSNGIYKDNMG
ncbi:uncharacterized protein EV420DRAFT_1281031, partial [Desarmillaria tabescens]